MAALNTRKENTAWSNAMGNSRLEGDLFSQWKLRVLCLFLYPFLPIITFFVLVGIFKVPILIIAFTIAVVLAIVGSAGSAYIKIMKADRLFVDGVSVIYTGESKATFLYLLKEKFLNVVTLGIWWVGGFGTRLTSKERYAKTTRDNESSNLKRSGFIGKVLHIIVPKIIITSIPIILMIFTHLIPIRSRSELFWTELARAGTRLTNPTMNLWGLTKALARSGVESFKNPVYYNEVTTLLITAILVFIAVSLLIPWYRYKMIKWEIDNTSVDGYRFRFKATYGEYSAVTYINFLMLSIPSVLYILLLVNKAKIIPSLWLVLLILDIIVLWLLMGYTSCLSARLRAENTVVVKPVGSSGIPWERYMVPEKELSLSFIESEKDVFNPTVRRKNATYFKRYWTLYALMAIPLIYLLVFKYIPMLYIQIGFKQNNIYIPVSDVSWANEYGFAWLNNAFKTRDFLLALRNTLMLNGLDLIVGFPAPIILALLLNELVFKRYKRIAQTVFYMPHFLSWVIIASLALQLFNGPTGLVNQVTELFGGSPLRPFENNVQWVVMYVLLGVWQGAGWGTIIYLAAIAGISPDLYEAASIDGASRWRKMWHITLTGIRPTIIILLIMRMGSIIGSDFERPFALRNNLIIEVSDMISIFIYQRGILGMQFPLTAAVGIFQSVICLIFLFAANALAKRVGERGIL